jgi:predicted dehydrogenase
METEEQARLRVGVVGLRMGAGILNVLVEDPRVEVRAICDLTTELAQGLAAKHEIPAVYTSYEEMLAGEDLDGMCVATPNRLHTPMVRAALARGLHVFCEKPLTLDIDEARALVEEAEAAGVTHGINFSNRPNPAVRYMQEQIEAGMLGRVYEIHLAYLQDWLSDPSAPYSWRNSRVESGSGALGDIGSHVLDLGRLFLGEVTGVSAQLAVVTPERLHPDGTVGMVDADDLAYLHLRYATGAHGLLRVSRVARGRCDLRRVELFGERASLVLEIDSQVCRVLRADEVTAWRGDGFREVFAHDPRRTNWGGNVTAWIEAALARRQMTPSFVDGLRCQEILDAAIRSDATHRWVEVSPY